jgi:hypothetical protein
MRTNPTNTCRNLDRRDLGHLPPRRPRQAGAIELPEGVVENFRSDERSSFESRTEQEPKRIARCRRKNDGVPWLAALVAGFAWPFRALAGVKTSALDRAAETSSHRTAR